MMRAAGAASGDATSPGEMYGHLNRAPTDCGHSVEIAGAGVQLGLRARCGQ